MDPALSGVFVPAEISSARPRHRGLFRFFAHLLVRLLIIGPWPADLQAKAALFPASMLWALASTEEEPPAASGMAVDPENPAIFPDGRIKSHTDAFNKTIQYSHDLSARQEIVTDRNGAVRVLEYDPKGNVVKETDPNGKVVRRTFDGRNNRLTETEPHDLANPTPPTTTYTYDANDNLLTTKDALDNTTEHTYNARKQVLTTKDACGKFTVNAYDPKGNLTSAKTGGATATGPFQAETTYTYDPNGNVKTQAVTVGGVVQTTSFDYNTFGHLTKETDANLHETSYTYDSNGNRQTQSTTRTLYACPAGTCAPSGTETLTTTYEYDRQGRVTKMIDPDATFTRTVYDEVGKQKESYDKLNRRTQFEYDDMGRLKKTTYPDLTFEESTYDNEGQRRTSSDRGGRITEYVYDELGRLKKTIFPDLKFTENTYADVGRLVATKDARGKTTTYEYDAAGRRTKVKDPLNNETVFTYDGNGNQRTVRDARLNTTTYEYDDLNRRTKTIFPDTTFTETTYDELGHRTSERDQAGKVTQFQYDKLGRLVKVIDALLQETGYAYDEMGKRISQTDANGHTTFFLYDRLGRETARILPDGSQEGKTYNPTGNPETHTDFMGRTTTYGYDPNNNWLTSRTYPSSAENVSFTYTATGRRLTATDSRGTTEYGYDSRDRLLSLTQPGVGSLGYTYDGNGNRLTLTATIGGSSYTTSYEYDDASRLDIVTDPAARLYDHGYDDNGNRTSLVYPNATARSYVYNSLNRLTNLTTTGPLGTVFSQVFELGNAGNRTKIVENDGTTKDYAYDALYRLKQEKVTDSVGLAYQKDFDYDPVGNRLQQTTMGQGAGTIGHTYDTRDRLLTENANSLTYDSNGNLTAKVSEATYVWDHENRLIRVTKDDGTVVETGYDADANRVQTTVSPSTGPPTVTSFLVDLSGALSHVVAETDGTAVLVAYYVRGDDPLAVMRPAASGGWTSRFFHTDGLGSIRRLTDSQGGVTDGYSFEGYGTLLAHTGTDPQPYGFAGEPYESTGSLAHHRDRWYDSRIGRFMGMDRFRGRPENPLSLHKYSYAHLNPISDRDPTGQFAEFAIGGLITTLAAVSPLAPRAMLSAAGAAVLFINAEDEIIATESYQKRHKVSIVGADVARRDRFLVVQWIQGEYILGMRPPLLPRFHSIDNHPYSFANWEIDAVESSYAEYPGAPDRAGLVRYGKDLIDYSDTPGAFLLTGQPPKRPAAFTAHLQFQVNVYDKDLLGVKGMPPISRFNSPGDPPPIARHTWSFEGTHLIE